MQWTTGKVAIRQTMTNSSKQAAAAAATAEQQQQNSNTLHSSTQVYANKHSYVVHQRTVYKLQSGPGLLCCETAHGFFYVTKREKKQGNYNVDHVIIPCLYCNPHPVFGLYIK